MLAASIHHRSIACHIAGIREYAKRGGAALLSIREDEVEEWLASSNDKVCAVRGVGRLLTSCALHGSERWGDQPTSR